MGNAVFGGKEGPAYQSHPLAALCTGRKGKDVKEASDMLGKKLFQNSTGKLSSSAFGERGKGRRK